MSDHTITWTHGDGCDIKATVVCAAPETASCRYSCPEGCEVWEAEGHEHGYEVVDCLAVLWWANAISVTECGPIYSDAEPVRNGPIDVEWEGENWVWEYADQPTPAVDPALTEREACADRIRSFINRHEGNVSTPYIRGMNAALLVVEHRTFQDEPIPSEVKQS